MLAIDRSRLSYCLLLRLDILTPACLPAVKVLHFNKIRQVFVICPDFACFVGVKEVGGHSFLVLIPPPSPLGDIKSPLLWVGIMYFSFIAILTLLPMVFMHSLSLTWLFVVVYFIYSSPWGVSLLHSYLILVIRL